MWVATHKLGKKFIVFKNERRFENDSNRGCCVYKSQAVKYHPIV